MRQVLVAYGSVMGSTAEIAEWIAEELRRAGLQVVVCDATTAPSPNGFQAVVVGSAVYHGRWRPEAVRFLRDHRVALGDGRCGCSRAARAVVRDVGPDRRRGFAGWPAGWGRTARSCSEATSIRPERTTGSAAG